MSNCEHYAQYKFENKIYTFNKKKKNTLTGSLVRTFFWRNFSRLGGATSTTYGFKSEARKSFKLCGCKFNTHIFPLDTTVRIASREVPKTKKRISNSIG